ncbi:phosphodiesterase [Acinetobacter kookii]|uniref:phosphodiesterase n=1 Tax=Acinetobacter indicus TaxID=756892 RepID=UPI0025771C6A|nr:phosphodiesterase [Acinetobacter indicus]
MMKILSHRGYWIAPSEKNSITAFIRSFHLNFGTETDLRDHNGEIVISHDMPRNPPLLFKDFLKILGEKPLTLALNIKADGLAQKLKQIMYENSNVNWFIFDMSIPDMKSYLDLDMPTFTRLSDVEQTPIWLEHSCGVWLDSFYNDWYDLETINKLLVAGKQVCIVSPELHNRDYSLVWNMLYSLKESSGLMLCTDFPEKAQSFFFGS